MSTIDLKEMSEAELKAELKRRSKEKESDREAYKDLIQESIPGLIQFLLKASAMLSQGKMHVFKELETLMELKYKTYGIRENQLSHTFTAPSGDSITIGSRVVHTFDDTLNTGIEMVLKHLESLGSGMVSEQKQNLIDTVNLLLKRDKNGNLNPTRVLELKQMATKFNSELFDDGVNIIENAYKPVHSCWFIEASYLDQTGKKKTIPLSMSSVDFPEGLILDFLNHKNTRKDPS